jgi:hypothetical protein
MGRPRLLRFYGPEPDPATASVRLVGGIGLATVAQTPEQSQAIDPECLQPCPWLPHI